jgi:hypothetical protein
MPEPQTETFLLFYKCDRCGFQKVTRAAFLDFSDWLPGPNVTFEHDPNGVPPCNGRFKIENAVRPIQ